MSARTNLVPSLAAILMLASAVPAIADGPVIITQAKALAGNVTPGDNPGYPVSITKAGSYQLGSNLVPGAGHSGIAIVAPSVAIDFNGFTLIGGGVSEFGVWGKQQSATIRNGTISGMKKDGIHAEAYFWVVENMIIMNNGESGIAAYEYIRVQNSTLAQNAMYGFVCTFACHVEDNIIVENDWGGASVQGGTVLGNTIIGNGGPGILASYSSRTGYGNNTIDFNNKGKAEVTGTKLFPLHPNVCGDASCP
jgi:hypothetical protein